MDTSIDILKEVDSRAALGAAQRLLSRGATNRSPMRAVCHLQSLDLAAVERLENLVEDGDFIFEATVDATPDWRTRASSVLVAAETMIDLQYCWGTFSISCTDSEIRMRRSGSDRRLMRQGVGMYVRRHFRPALKKDGWLVAGDGGDSSVAREGQPAGQLRSAQDKFSEWGSLELTQEARSQLAQLSSVFLSEICENPELISVRAHGSRRAVIASARALGRVEETCFAYGVLGSNSGFVAGDRVLELMQTMSSLGSDGDFVCYPDLCWRDPESVTEGQIYLTMHGGGWTVSIAISETTGMISRKALAAIFAGYNSRDG
ncbi:MAG: hypothetical protein GY708_09690 [Actinomycetia bacterium]|nr:hypothetical protein [Actinomycetes bacterium]